MLRSRIKEIVEKNALPKYKEKQLNDAVFKQYIGSYSEITTLTKEQREKITANEVFLSLEPFKILISREKNAYKALLKLKSSGRLIESVLLNPKPGLWTTCISSQVGCAMNCSFCATGKMGFLQNLSAEEIFDQVLFWKQYIRRYGISERQTGKEAVLRDLLKNDEIQGNKEPLRAAYATIRRESGNEVDAGNRVYQQILSNVVYMGMGEPLANCGEVFASIRELVAEDGLNMASRNISVSTSGLVPGIAQLAKEFPQINLAISLHAADDDLRSKLMPINKSFPLARLAESIKDYLTRNNRKIFIEYILLAGENDSDRQAENLARWVKSLKAPHLVHVNLIVYNKTDTTHEESRRPQAFKAILIEKGIAVTIRKNLGRDIMAACGQLVTAQS